MLCADHPGADLAELVERAEHRDQLVVLRGEHLDRRTGHVERVGDRLLLGVEGLGQVVDRLHRVDDVVLLVVERADDVLERAEQVPEPVGAAVHHLLSSWVMVPSWATPPPLSRNDSAPSTSSTSGLRPVSASGDVVAVGEPAGRRRAGRRLERDVLLPQQADLADVGDRVVGQHDVVLDPQRDLGVPADPLDVGDLADGDVVDHHRRARARR